RDGGESGEDVGAYQADLPVVVSVVGHSRLGCSTLIHSGAGWPASWQRLSRLRLCAAQKRIRRPWPRWLLPASSATDAPPQYIGSMTSHLCFIPTGPPSRIAPPTGTRSAARGASGPR